MWLQPGAFEDFGKYRATDTLCKQDIESDVLDMLMLLVKQFIPVGPKGPLAALGRDVHSVQVYFGLDFLDGIYLMQSGECKSRFCQRGLCRDSLSDLLHLYPCMM